MEPMDLGGLLTVDTRRAATLNQGDADAARIALFLAYARDNAQLLGLTDAFDSEPIDVAHAGKLAVRVADGLGMDERAFGKYVETIAAKDLKRALASEYINPGVLEVTGDPGSDGRVSRALDLLEDISSDRNHQIFLAEAELARSVLLGARDGSHRDRHGCRKRRNHVNEVARGRVSGWLRACETGRLVRCRLYTRRWFRCRPLRGAPWLREARSRSDRG